MAKTNPRASTKFTTVEKEALRMSARFRQMVRLVLEHAKPDKEHHNDIIDYALDTMLALFDAKGTGKSAASVSRDINTGFPSDGAKAVRETDSPQENVR